MSELKPVPEDRGAWVRVIIDFPARHDDNLSESLELNVYLAEIMDLTFHEVIKRAESEAFKLLSTAAAKT